MAYDQLQSILSPDALVRLRDGLASSRSRNGLSPEAADVLRTLCRHAREAGMSPEQLVVAIKDTCYTTPELTQLTTTSERDALLAKVVTVCIKEYFRNEPDAQMGG